VLEEGKTIVIASVKYKILKITDDTHLTLVIDYAGVDASGLTITGTDIPKYIMQQDLHKVYFVDRTESQQPENTAKGLNEPGWWFYTSHVDAQGQTRHKAEHLVAMDITAAVSSDAADDAVVVDGTLTINTQPVNKTTTAGTAEASLFTVAATLVGGAGIINYQWQQAPSTGSPWTDLSDAGGVWTNVTTATLGVNAGMTDTSSSFNGTKFRCVITSDGVTSKTTTTRTLTVNP
jgi:hypothetical protein